MLKAELYFSVLLLGVVFAIAVHVLTSVLFATERREGPKHANSLPTLWD